MKKRVLIARDNRKRNEQWTVLLRLYYVLQYYVPLPGIGT